MDVQRKGACKAGVNRLFNYYVPKVADLGATISIPITARCR